MSKRAENFLQGLISVNSMQEKINKLNLSPYQMKNSNFGKFLESDLGKTYTAMEPFTELSWTHNNKSTIVNQYGKPVYNILIKIRQAKFEEATKLVLQDQIPANQNNNEAQDIQKALELSLFNKEQTEQKNNANTNNNTNEARDDDLQKALDISLQSQEQIEYNSNFDNMVRHLTSDEVKKLKNIEEVVLFAPKSNKNFAENLCPELFKDSKSKDNIIKMVNDDRFIEHCQDLFKYADYVKATKSKMNAIELAKFKALEDAAVFSINSETSPVLQIALSSFEDSGLKSEILEITGDHFFPQYALGDI